MQSTWHPPVTVARRGAGSRSGSTERAYGHVRVWVRLPIEPWGVVREGHLHLLLPLASDASFSVVDLSRRPLVAIPSRKEPEGLRAQLTTASEAWLRAWRPTFWRLPELGLVSELGETEDGFCRRARGLLRPELQRRLDRLHATPLPRLPWRRRSELDRRRRVSEELTGAVARVMGGLETWTADGAIDRVCSLESGLLVANEDLLVPDPSPAG
jgi:hypothetical protein